MRWSLARSKRQIYRSHTRKPQSGWRQHRLQPGFGWFLHAASVEAPPKLGEWRRFIEAGGRTFSGFVRELVSVAMFPL